MDTGKDNIALPDGNVSNSDLSKIKVRDILEQRFKVTMVPMAKSSEVR